MIVLLGAAMLRAAPGRPIMLLALLPPAVHLLWQARTLRQAGSVSALRLFRSNEAAGFLVFLACAAVGL